MTETKAMPSPASPASLASLPGSSCRSKKPKRQASFDIKRRMRKMRCSFLKEKLETRPNVHFLQYGDITLIKHHDSMIDSKPECPAEIRTSRRTAKGSHSSVATPICIEEDATDHLEKRIRHLKLKLENRPGLKIAQYGNISLIDRIPQCTQSTPRCRPSWNKSEQQHTPIYIEEDMTDRHEKRISLLKRKLENRPHLQIAQFGKISLINRSNEEFAKHKQQSLHDSWIDCKPPCPAELMTATCTGTSPRRTGSRRSFTMGEQPVVCIEEDATDHLEKRISHLKRKLENRPHLYISTYGHISLIHRESMIETKRGLMIPMDKRTKPRRLSGGRGIYSKNLSHGEDGEDRELLKHHLEKQLQHRPTIGLPGDCGQIADYLRDHLVEEVQRILEEHSNSSTEIEDLGDVGEEVVEVLAVESE